MRARCHGYSLGKNGFKLSLRGADPAPDYFAITKDSAGRRLNFQSASDSLLVGKPAGDVPHEGGMRLPQAACRMRFSSNGFSKALRAI